MNKRHFIQLAKVIEKAGRFDLGSYANWIDDDIVGDEWADKDIEFHATEILHNCNTTGCVAGWTNAILRNDVADDNDTARDWLGITNDESSQLFFDYGGLWDGYDQQDAGDAGRLLRDLVAGTVQFKDVVYTNGWPEWVSRG